MLFMQDRTSIGHDLEIRQSGRNEGIKVVVADKSSKLRLYDNSKECEEKM